MTHRESKPHIDHHEIEGIMRLGMLDFPISAFGLEWAETVFWSSLCCTRIVNTPLYVCTYVSMYVCMYVGR